MRETINGNLTASQLLSPTTVIDGGYGVTYEHGTLDTGWNAVPISAGVLTDEVLPRGRLRHALAARLAQHVPWTHTTLKAWYRFYLDDGACARTRSSSPLPVHRPWLYVRGGYRYHHQTGVDFFTTGWRTKFTSPRRAPPTRISRRSRGAGVGVQLATVRGRGRRRSASWSLGAELMRYWRTNDLRITRSRSGSEGSCEARFGAPATLALLAACLPTTPSPRAGCRARPPRRRGWRRPGGGCVPAADALPRQAGRARLLGRVVRRRRKRAVPQLVRLADGFAANGLVVVGVDAGDADRRRDPLRARARHHLPDRDGPRSRVRDRLGASELPMLVVIDRTGTIVHRSRHLDEDTLGAIRRVLE